MPLQDAQRALRLIRASAAGYGIDPRRVGIVGFSAAVLSRRISRWAPASASTRPSTPPTAFQCCPILQCCSTRLQRCAHRGRTKARSTICWGPIHRRRWSTGARRCFTSTRAPCQARCSTRSTTLSSPGVQPRLAGGVPRGGGARRGASDRARRPRVRHRVAASQPGQPVARAVRSLDRGTHRIAGVGMAIELRPLFGSDLCLLVADARTRCAGASCVARLA